MSTLEENLRVAQPEIEPLHMKKKEEDEQITKVPINDVPSDTESVYNKTTVEKAPLKLRTLLTQVRNSLRPTLLKNLRDTPYRNLMTHCLKN